MFASLIAAVAFSGVRQEPLPPVLVGYVPAWSYQEVPASAYEHVTDVIAFSVEPTRDGKIESKDLPERVLSDLNDLRAKHGFRLLLAIGGWERSSGFATVSADVAKREKFAREVKTWVEKYRLDGIDLDWEHPKNADEARNYAALARSIKRAIGKDKLVTAAMAAWQEYPPELILALDRLHLMSYDHPGEHSTRDQAIRDVDAVAFKGMPKEKIVLGVPFYGRNVEKFEEAKSARELLLDATRQGDRVGSFFFNSEATLREKARVVKDQKLGGVMVWELSQDTKDGSLIRALREALGRLGDGS